MNRFAYWLSKRSFPCFMLTMAGMALTVVGLVLVLVWLGVVRDLNCPEGARQMIYTVGKVSRTVCAVEVPER